MKISLKRLAAYGADFLLLASILVCFQYLLYLLTPGFPFDDLDSGWEIEIWVLLTMSFPVWTYFILCEFFAQKTVGKKIWGLKVTNEEGANLRFRQALIRTFIRLLPWELTHLIILVPDPWWSVEKPGNTMLIYIPNIMMIMYIVILFRNKGVKGIHDYIARTKIVANTLPS